ncbi:ATP-dependent Lon protease [Desulfoluna limicola]|uniref:ATP-dependent Lon protease n=1 Tax=Desulfoluna limicola TaxID=2810562 RepID=A0ABM7PJF0_9BACT|nr:BREX system Lon protease-like protein BrxL [Desulfoluna limicola]BCS97425.1 ATP-dependent Lon protease [Desulfoluna limicola]
MQLTALDQKINEHFPGLVVRKDLVKTVKGNAIVPTYVLEYLLGQYCATSDEASIQSGIDTVKEILRRHYVHRNEAGLIKSTIREKGRHKVIDKISVSLNDKSDVYEATFGNLGIKKVLVDTDTVKSHPKLLVSGVWCLADLEYEHTEDKNTNPWILDTLKPIQLSHFDIDSYTEARAQFSTDEWIDILLQSLGLNPEMFGRRNKLMQLVRLIPFCERNYNLIELGPKGTGKSHVYSEFSPHGILLSGGEVSVPKLFVNNSSGKIGLVGYWDTVAFDEFAGQGKRVDKALVDIMKNYMANKTFSRGVETLGADASMAFVGNTRHPVAYMLRHTDLFDELPEKYHDTAFLDRLHFYLPGWEVDIIRGEMFSEGYGFVVDYLAEVLKHFRNHDLSQVYTEHFELLKDLSTRDKDGIQKTFSGMMKILYPHGQCTAQEMEEIFQFAMEGRKRVKDQLLRIDETYRSTPVTFGYKNNITGDTVMVQTLEERNYPKFYRGYETGEEPSEEPTAQKTTCSQSTPSEGCDEELKETHIDFQENQTGITYDALFGAHIRGAKEITITDPYIRKFHQARNLMEFMETVAKVKENGDIVSVTLITVLDEFDGMKQTDLLEKVQEACSGIGIELSCRFAEQSSIHDRSIETDHGWKIILGRGLDIFQNYEMGNAFSFANKLQQFRACRPFGVSYHRLKI